MPRRSSRTSRQPSRLGYLDSTMADMKEGKGTSLEPTELELPPSPSSSSTSSLSVSSCSKSSSVRKLKAEANLEMARRMQKIEEEEADRRLERQKKILRLELEAKQPRLMTLRHHGQAGHLGDHHPLPVTHENDSVRCWTPRR